MGTADFAVPSLRECAVHHDVCAVVTQPPRPGKRGHPATRPVADEAHSRGIPLMTPERIADRDTTEAVLALKPDGIVVAAYGQILPEPLLQNPQYGAINVHASLLPRWRGAAPIAHAILAGDAETGVSIMQMEASLDTGPVLASARVPIPQDATTLELTAELAALGAELLSDVLRLVERGETMRTPQPSEGVTYAPRLRRSDGELEWSLFSAVEIDRRVRALQPWPGVWLPLQGHRLRILAGGVADDDHENADAPGEIVARQGESVVVNARVGAYRIDRVVPPNANAMSPAAFLRGKRSAR